MKKGSHASPEERKRMKEGQLRARAARLPYVTPEQLVACRLDLAWEARQGMANCVVCRECGAKLQSPLGGNEGHLWRLHEMTVRAYRADTLALEPVPILHGRSRAGQIRSGGCILSRVCLKCGKKFQPSRRCPGNSGRGTPGNSIALLI